MNEQLFVEKMLNMYTKALANSFHGNWKENYRMKKDITFDEKPAPGKLVHEISVSTEFFDLVIELTEDDGWIYITPSGYFKLPPQIRILDGIFRDGRKKPFIHRNILDFDELGILACQLGIISHMGEEKFRKDAEKRYGYRQNNEHIQRLLERYVDLSEKREGN